MGMMPNGLSAQWLCHFCLTQAGWQAVRAQHYISIRMFAWFYDENGHLMHKHIFRLPNFAGASSPRAHVLIL